MDLIKIRGIEVLAFHGVLPEERQIGQRFVVDLDLELDLTAAGASDDLTATVDYGAIAKTVAAVVEGEQWHLIEKLATRVAEETLAIYQHLAAVTVTVHKPEAPIQVPFDDVAVAIRRTR